MARYVLEIAVSASKIQEVEQPEDDITLRPGEDPMRVQAQLLQKASKMFDRQLVVFQRPAGVSLSRSISVRAESFAALADILGQFDGLAEKIECSNP